DMVRVSALDGALSVSWNASKNAAWYEVYYTTAGNAAVSSYTLWSGALNGTRTTITGLTNDTAYSIYVVAGNEVGRSGPSLIATGTPKAVSYVRPEGIPTEGVLDYRDFQDIRLAAPSNYSREECPNFTPWHMADGDYRTQWTTQNWWSNEHVLVTFKEPQDLSAAIWVLRMDGTYASNLRTYSVQVWYDGENLNGPGHLVTSGTDHNNMSQADVDSWPNVRGNPSVTRFAVMPFAPQRKVVRISVAAEQAAYNQVNLSELMFLKYDENHRLPDDIAELFADGLRTTLASGVTQARIDQLRQRLESDEKHYYLDLQAMDDELTMAKERLNGQTGSSVVLWGVDSRSAKKDDDAFGQSGSELQPLGVTAGAGTEITVYAQGIPAGKTVAVYATQYYAEASPWRASMGTLTNGRNVLTVPRIGSLNDPRGGSLYIAYDGPDARNIRLHVRRGTPIPVLDLSGWNTMGDTVRTQAVNSYLSALDTYLAGARIGDAATDWRNVTEIATPSVLLSVPAKAVQSALRDNRAAQLLRSVEAWEELMQVCRTVQGITGTMETRQNIRYMRMFDGAFMYAAGSHIGVGYNSCAGLVSGAAVENMAAGAESNSLFGWGIAHEIGHNMDKLGKAEITNNIYALAAQTYDGKQNTLRSRLEKSGKYAAIFNKVAQGHAGASGDVFVQLGMYWQLHLAYDGGDAPLDFYTRFFTAWKAGTCFGGAESYDDKVALTASAVTGKNLTDFFTHWGMTLSESARTRLKAYDPEPRAIWYLNDGSRRDRLKNVPAASGTVTASAALKAGSNNEIILTFGTDLVNNGGKVQGYEIRRGDTPIAFTTDGTYTDVIGSGNNRTYTYTVAAYDTLGNRIGEATTKAVLVAYDLLVDSTGCEMSRENGVLHVTFSKATAVTGLKLPTGTKIDGLRVTVTEDGRTFSIGHTPDRLREDSTITYFQRPEADESQATQVWTYQATALTISGLPESIRPEEVRLISYMVDSIDFLSGPTVGRMAHDYWCGPGAADVIKKDTLVVIGTYRGDPTYSTVRIEGDFSAPDMSKANGDQDPQN
ncbi:MAG: M60 family metallopeptidase, partial [Oscillospiraceae bacterium]|nr:M60 family metallopeptidase [Oscillospiraceae bacterium]